jgi:large subunit ribosomal protein L19
MGYVEEFEKQQMKSELPELRIGDKVKVSTRIIEGNKQRTQVFEGTIIGRHRGANRATVTVRKVSHGVGVERVFPVHSPNVEKIEVITHTKVRRAKLYFLRKLRGKSARLKELTQ